MKNLYALVLSLLIMMMISINSYSSRIKITPSFGRWLKQRETIKQLQLKIESLEQDLEYAQSQQSTD